MEIEVGYCYLQPAEQIELCELFFDYYENPDACSYEKIDKIEVLMNKLVIPNKPGSQETYGFVDFKKLSLVLYLYLIPIFDEGRSEALPKCDAPWDTTSIGMNLPKKPRRNTPSLEI